MSRVVGLVCAIVLTFLGVRAGHAEKRVALVVGNSVYRSVATLDNPANDAKLVANTLSALGFTLVGGGAQLDLDKASFDQTVQAFGTQLAGADVGLFYYAGHGVQVRGANYLIPVDANPTKEADIDFQMLDANLVLRQMESAGTRLNIVILDACRNNPFGGRSLAVAGGRMRDTSSGLAQMQAPEGTLISFATQPGSVAQDGADGDSPYARALTLEMRRPGLDIFQTFNQVGLAVKRATGGMQQPWVSSSPIDGSFYFVAPPVDQQNAVPLGDQPGKAPRSAMLESPSSLASDLPQADGLFTEQDMQRVKAIALKDGLEIMPPFKIERPDSKLPAALRRFIGIWASEIGFDSGRSRHAMLIVTNIEAAARATGYWVWGSPTGRESKEDQFGAGVDPFDGKVTADKLIFQIRKNDVTATLNSGGALAVVTRRGNGRTGYVTVTPVWQLIDAERSAKQTADASVVRSEPADQRSKIKSPAAASTIGPSAALPPQDQTRLGSTPDVGHFDGTWFSRVVCTPTSDALGYEFQFVGEVKDGAFHGVHGVIGKPDSTSFDGAIKADGTAEITATGLTGDSKTVSPPSPPGTKFDYKIVAKFQGSSGTGIRFKRHCDYVFVKQ